MFPCEPLLPMGWQLGGNLGGISFCCSSNVVKPAHKPGAGNEFANIGGLPGLAPPSLTAALIQVSGDAVASVSQIPAKCRAERSARGSRFPARLCRASGHRVVKAGAAVGVISREAPAALRSPLRRDCEV